MGQHGSASALWLLLAPRSSSPPSRSRSARWVLASCSVRRLTMTRSVDEGRCATPWLKTEAEAGPGASKSAAMSRTEEGVLAVRRESSRRLPLSLLPLTPSVLPLDPPHPTTMKSLALLLPLVALLSSVSAAPVGQGASLLSPSSTRALTLAETPTEHTGADLAKRLIWVDLDGPGLDFYDGWHGIWKRDVDGHADAEHLAKRDSVVPLDERDVYPAELDKRLWGASPLSPLSRTRPSQPRPDPLPPPPLPPAQAATTLATAATVATARRTVRATTAGSAAAPRVATTADEAAWPSAAAACTGATSSSTRRFKPT
ncbi:hypothetical protein DMC30DRAFT_14798 [Rhodotorula diobovata]|uniref:Uncharacterized protein n=1 Tax=Rhodotorula diobovata TaxID=5288 RepID=A0A5C5FSN4_9BASI|nr:hypothetical protein DMC30DRAFT_14798 [Rhodotorula diobovata]